MRRLFIALAAAALGACGDEAPGPVVRTAAERGALLFRDPGVSRNSFNEVSCATCHETAQHPASGRRLTGAPLDGATRRPTFWGGQENDLLRSVDNCLRLFMLDPGLARDEARAADLYAFLDALPAAAVDPAPFSLVASVKDVPTGDAARGERLYGQACAACHGTLHEGVGRLPTASLLPEDTIAEHSQYGADELRLTAIEKIRHGLFFGYGGRMPPFSTETLSDDELGDVLQYLGFLPLGAQ